LDLDNTENVYRWIYCSTWLNSPQFIGAILPSRMKAIFICVIIAMLGSAQGFKDSERCKERSIRIYLFPLFTGICNLDPFVQGPCLEVMTLYSYLSARNECVFWQGCLLNGNQFTNKTECEAKCKTSFLR